MLGKGLESLIPKRQLEQQPDQEQEHKPQDRIEQQNPEASTPRRNSAPREENPGEPVFQIEIDKVTTNPYQPRRQFDESMLADLASSIREYGVIQPLIVTKIEKQTEMGTDVEYQLIAGERRLRAAKLSGLERVPAIVRTVSLPNEQLELAIIENLQREDLNSIEAARSFARLQDEFGFTQREIAARIGKSRETVSNTIRLLSLPSFIQDALEQNHINESHARLLLGITDLGEQKAVFNKLVNTRISVRALKEQIQRRQKSRDTNTGATKHTPYIHFAEEQLQEFFGAPVRVQHTGTEGKVVITFYSEEELQGLLNRISRGDA